MKHIKLYEANWRSDKYPNPGYLIPEDIGEPGEMIVAWSNRNGEPGVALCTQEQALQLKKISKTFSQRRDPSYNGPESGSHPTPDGTFKIIPAEGMAYVTFGPYTRGDQREIQALTPSQQIKTSIYEVFLSSAYPIESEGSNENPLRKRRSGYPTYASTLKRGHILCYCDVWDNNYGQTEYDYTKVEEISEYIDRNQDRNQDQPQIAVKEFFKWYTGIPKWWFPSAKGEARGPITDSMTIDGVHLQDLATPKERFAAYSAIQRLRNEPLKNFKIEEDPRSGTYIHSFDLEGKRIAVQAMEKYDGFSKWT